MISYIGTKIVNAIPMTRLEYNNFREWALPVNENGADAGYLVEYTDGGEPNTNQYAGYVSWSPKEQFDNAYVKVGDVSSLQPDQQRIIAELEQLADRTTKLKSFLQTELFLGLEEGEQYLLKIQVNAMVQYLNILNNRVEYFNK